eukprot:1184972-Prorocentrum_minimum.AAC.7
MSLSRSSCLDDATDMGGNKVEMTSHNDANELKGEKTKLEVAYACEAKFINRSWVGLGRARVQSGFAACLPPTTIFTHGPSMSPVLEEAPLLSGRRSSCRTCPAAVIPHLASGNVAGTNSTVAKGYNAHDDCPKSQTR